MPICTIVPPYILARLAHSERRNGRVCEAAARTLELTRRLNAERHESTAKSSERTTRAVEQACVRIVYDARGRTTLPGTRVRSEGDDVVADTIVDEAYAGPGLVYRFFNEVFKRNSIDGRGMHLVSSVHFSYEFHNAFWNGRQVVYGDGDEDVFSRFTFCPDIVCHEFMHGITQHECGLGYDDQAGALNESISDVFGSLLKQWHRKQTVDEADWLIGDGVFLVPRARALRSLKAPGHAYNSDEIGRDPQPWHMRDYVADPDWGGIFLNSGIPNHAFFLAAKALGGYAWETVGPIWYATVRGELPADATFAAFARATLGHAASVSSDAERAVRHGWRVVGVLGGDD